MKPIHEAGLDVRARREVVIQAIEQHEEDFDMSVWSCGTKKCLAGWAVSIFEPEVFEELRMEVGESAKFIEAGARVLGLSECAAESLFLSCVDVECISGLLRAEPIVE